MGAVGASERGGIEMRSGHRREAASVGAVGAPERNAIKNEVGAR